MTNKPKYYNLSVDELNKNIENINDELDKIWNNDYTWEEYVKHCQPYWDELLEYQAALFLKKDITDVKFTKHSALDKECLVPMKEFIDWCNDHFVIGYDGYGYYSNENESSDIPAFPSHFEKGYIRDDFNYVVWYNN